MRTFREYLVNEIENRKICVYGMGSFGMASTEELVRNGFTIDCFVDKSMREIQYMNIKRISFTELTAKVDEYVVIVAVGDALAEVISTLECIHAKIIIMGSPYRFQFEETRKLIPQNQYNEFISKTRNIFHDEKSLQVFDIMERNWRSFDYSINEIEEIRSKVPYFDEEVIPELKEIGLVDCGAFTGDTLKSFLEVCKFERLKNYYAFELSKKNYLDLTAYITQIDVECIRSKIIAINKGVSDHSGTIKYVDDLGAASRLEEKKDGEIGVVTQIDDELKNQEIDFIKMDIEGAEMEALRGARETIRLQHPIIAVCVYHKLTDLWEVPAYIKSVRDDYSFYLRQYSDALVDCVLYAIPMV